MSVTVHSVTILRALEESVAIDGRRILSPWYAALILRRATQKIPLYLRRWKEAPQSARDARLILERLVKRGELEYIDKAGHIYKVTSPFASTSPIDEYEILFAYNPYCAISHHSALLFHQLTITYSKFIHVSMPSQNARPTPVGTTDEDWDFKQLPQSTQVPKINKLLIQWHQLKCTEGTREFRPFGYPIRVTSIERTLLDGLLEPEWCGGFENVLLAWKEAKDRINIEYLVQLTDKLNIKLLRQRVGFLLKKLGLDHPRLKEWKKNVSRGGSARLVAKNEYASTYDEEWAISINVSLRALDEMP